MNTGNAKMSGAQREKGPRSLYDSVGRRKTPLPMTALMHMATKPQKPTARTSFSDSVTAVRYRTVAAGPVEGNSRCCPSNRHEHTSSADCFRGCSVRRRLLHFSAPYGE